MKNLFVSYHATDEARVEDLTTHLENVFSRESLQVFQASRPESVSPGDAWQNRIIDTLTSADALMVLMTVNALTRPWVNFEIGAAWAKEARILIFCDGGMTPAALPTPYNSLQAVDLNGLSHTEKLDLVATTVGNALDIRHKEDTTPGIDPAQPINSLEAILRSWNLRPSGHVGATTTGEFLVGTVGPVRIERARAAGFQPGEAVFVRLFLGRAPEGRYINAMAKGDVATLFENLTRDVAIVQASLTLAASFQESDSAIPLIVVDSAEEIGPRN